MNRAAMPLELGRIHFVGIGGIGMSGIAEILHNLGYSVSGSDQNENANVERLREMGITIHIGHTASNIEGAGVVVKSTAVPLTNPEIVAAKDAKIPVVKRSEMLAELTKLKHTVAVAGTHGKTTTTSLVSAVFEAAGMEPTVINGGILNSHGTNAYLGKGEWMIAEADESDGTFIRIPATIGIITNIDPEHLDYWGSYHKLKAAFRQFIENLPFYGFAVVCRDNKEAANLAKRVTDRKVLFYGEHKKADVRISNIQSEVDGSTFDIEVSDRLACGETKIEGIKLSKPGAHNVLNAAAALTIALEMQMNMKQVIKGLSSFGGVKRRFTKTGEVNGVTVIDDYGHHPTEIAATLGTARQVVPEGKGKVVAVMQPHRYSRLENLFDDFAGCFAQADKVYVTEVYSAGEQPIAGVDHVALVEAINQKGTVAEEVPDMEALVENLSAEVEPGDIVICLGAGDITKWAYQLPQMLGEVMGETSKKAAS